MNLQLINKLALVSGSTAGIGAAIAEALAAEGARVIINGRTQARVDATIKQILVVNPDAKLEGFAGDLATEAGTKELVARFPKVDVLVNNLGIFEPKEFTAIPDEDWTRFFAVNVLSGVRLSRAYLPGMLEQNWGRIVFISSESGLNIPKEMIHYGMTKSAQISVARGLAELTAGSNVTVNSVLPGPTRSEGVEDFVGKLSNGKSFEEFEREFFEKVRPTSLIKRFASVQEVASMVTYVCSPLASATNGAALRVEGGCVNSAF